MIDKEKFINQEKPLGKYSDKDLCFSIEDMRKILNKFEDMIRENDRQQY